MSSTKRIDTACEELWSEIVCLPGTFSNMIVNDTKYKIFYVYITREETMPKLQRFCFINRKDASQIKDFGVSVIELRSGNIKINDLYQTETPYQIYYGNYL